MDKTPMLSKTENLPELLTPAEAAAIARCSARTIRRMCSAGLITAAKPGGVWLINRDKLLTQLTLFEA